MKRLYFLIGIVLTSLLFVCNAHATLVLISNNTMTSNGTSTGYAVNSSGWQPPYESYKAFDGGGNYTLGWISASVGNETINHWIWQYIPGGAFVSKYEIYCPNGSIYSPRSWQLLGSNDLITMTVLDTVTDYRTGSGVVWGPNPFNKTISVQGPFKYIKLNVTLGWATEIRINEMFLYNDTVNVPPVASFTTDVTEGTDPLLVTFTDTSTNTPTGWSWKRRNNTAQTGEEFSTVQHPSAIFGVGNYSVNLTATNGAGSDTSDDTWINVSASVGEAPIVQWVKSKSFVMFPGIMYFNDTSIYVPTSWLWVFGDGHYYYASTNATGLNYTYQYKDRGKFNANLTVCNTNGCNTSATQTIEVMGYI